MDADYEADSLPRPLPVFARHTPSDARARGGVANVELLRQIEWKMRARCTTNKNSVRS